MKKKIIYASAVLLCCILPLIGYLPFALKDNAFGPDSDIEYMRVKITEVTNTKSTHLENGDMVDTVHTFTARVTRGEHKGEIITATQTISSYAPFNPRPVSVGDNAIVYELIIGEEISWCFAEYVRSDAIWVLCILFCLSLVVFGKSKGVKTLLSLILTLVSVFLVLIPIILNGGNIYIWTIITCLYITTMTLIIVNGISYMSLVAGLGCMGGVLIAAVITAVMDLFLKLTGFTDEHALYLPSIGTGEIDVKALVFAGILVGAIGAVMDVAVNISASLHEIACKLKTTSFKELFKSGLTISRDIIGTMSNTLILAYIGSALCSVLLIIHDNSFSMLNLFNKENIVVEILQIIVGSFGILSALPLTSFISAVFYSKSKFQKSLQYDYENVLNRKEEKIQKNAKFKKEKIFKEESDEYVELLKSADDK